MEHIRKVQYQQQDMLAEKVDFDSDWSLTRSSTLTPAESPLLKLPVEILEIIASYDDSPYPRARFSLSLTCVHLYRAMGFVELEYPTYESPEVNNDPSIRAHARLLRIQSIERAFSSHFFCVLCKQWHMTERKNILYDHISTTQPPCVKDVCCLQIGTQYALSYNAIRLASLRYYCSAPYGISTDELSWQGFVQPTAIDKYLKRRCLRRRRLWNLRRQDPMHIRVQARVVEEPKWKLAQFTLKAEATIYIDIHRDREISALGIEERPVFAKAVVGLLPLIVASNAEYCTRRYAHAEASSCTVYTGPVPNHGLAQHLEDFLANEMQVFKLPSSRHTSPSNVSKNVTLRSQDGLLSDHALHAYIESRHKSTTGTLVLRITTYRDVGGSTSPSRPEIYWRCGEKRPAAEFRPEAFPSVPRGWRCSVSNLDPSSMQVWREGFIRGLYEGQTPGQYPRKRYVPRDDAAESSAYLRKMRRWPDDRCGCSSKSPLTYGIDLPPADEDDEATERQSCEAMGAVSIEDDDPRDWTEIVEAARRRWEFAEDRAERRASAKGKEMERGQDARGKDPRWLEGYRAPRWAWWGERN